jgi:CheY-like chemotaxis protein
VLCIDDDPSILEGLVSLLGRWGCSVLGARDEVDALAALEGGFVPDAVLCDYQLANHRTGAQALTAVRNVLARAGHDNVVTLLITGDMASAELAALALQGIPVLHKPVTPARLRRTLEMLWQQAEQDKGRAAAALELRVDQTGHEAGGRPVSGVTRVAEIVPQGEARIGVQSQTQSQTQSTQSQSAPQK